MRDRASPEALVYWAMFSLLSNGQQPLQAGHERQERGTA